MARNGSSPDALRKRALKRQVSWRENLTEYEAHFLTVLTNAGLVPIPQLAVESFNIDFAFPDEMLAVELDPRWHNSPAKRPADARKDERLTALGWSVLRLDTRTSDEYNVAKVLSALSARASTHSPSDNS
ncbi:MAG: endonuclease domain-containing protein [Anaerolineae bacterium]|nr:endonuclease domain-containing protein [Anaerolineae bacterium]